MPSTWCSKGLVFWITISVSWTMAAMVTMNDSVRRYSSPKGSNR
jgi:hypothetical protein